jgi:hypothetical protein
VVQLAATAFANTTPTPLAADFTFDNNYTIKIGFKIQ